MTDVGVPDEHDADTTEAAVTTSLTELFAHPTHPRVPPSFESIRDALSSGPGLSLNNYASRVASDFGLALDDHTRAMELAARLVPTVQRQVIADAAQSAAQILKNGALTFEGGIESDTALYQRLTTGLEQVARLATTRLRETLKYDMARKLGVVGSVWHTRRDGRVRISHADLEGVFEPIDTPYVTVKGNSLLYPGQIGAPLEEVIGCRCQLSFRLPS